MKAIEKETFISSDGKLPLSFYEAFGKKANVIVMFTEQAKVDFQTECKAQNELWNLQARLIPSETLTDAVAFQHQIRNEWTREFEMKSEHF